MTELPSRKQWLAAPHLSARVSAVESASLLARLIASGSARTRAELVRRTGLPRSTVSTGLSMLQRLGVVEIDGVQPAPGRGRPGELLRIDPDFGIIVAIEVDLERAAVALFDFGQDVVACFDTSIALTDPPGEVVQTLAAATRSWMQEHDEVRPLRAVAVAVAAPVDIRHGMIVGPSFLADWDAFALEAAFTEAFGTEATLRTDTGLRAFGEARSTPPDHGALVYFRIGEGVGTGYVDTTSTIVTGADGAAGEIGHMRTIRREGRICLCGSADHLLSYGSIAAMLAEWQASDARRSTDTITDLEHALRLHDLDATRIAIAAAREIGSALTELILTLNPERIIIGGRILDSCDAILATIRAVVYDSGLPLATRNLTIARSELGESAGLYGGLALALEKALSASQLAQFALPMAHR